MDVAKTRLQRQVIVAGTPPKYEGALHAVAVISREEGLSALWKGLTPRLMRIMPGQVHAPLRTPRTPRTPRALVPQLR